VVVTVPFGVDDALLHRSAREYGVLWTPMAHFYDAGTPVNALRLSVSAVTPEQIDLGLDRLTALITDKLTAVGAPA
jgi:(S)-3,5-dihydroxyphenylglycine transaminase